MKRFKNENGAITILVLTSILFMVSFLISTYVIVANRVQIQKEIISEIRRTYEPEKSLEEIYNSYFDEDGIIPIYIEEQLLAIGTGEKLNINGKIYTFSNDAVYMLKNDIDIVEESEEETYEPPQDVTIDGSNYVVTVTDFEEQVKKYKSQNGVLQFYLEGYTKLSYIQGDGTQYINTEFIPDQDIKIEVNYDFKWELNSGQYVPLYGNTDVYAAFRPSYVLFYVKYGTYSNNYSGSKYPTGILTQNKNVFIFSPSGRRITPTNNDFTSTTPIYIFNVCNANEGLTYTYSTDYFKVYYFKIWHGDELVRDYAPYKRNSDKKIGLYDLVNNAFYTSSSGYDFTGE